MYQSPRMIPFTSLEFLKTMTILKTGTHFFNIYTEFQIMPKGKVEPICH